VAAASTIEDAARREGSLTFYTSISEKDLPVNIAPF
jgi:hypothetical protein